MLVNLRKLFLIVALVAVISAQSLNLFSVFNIKVNAILAFLVVLTFFLEKEKNYFIILFLTALIAPISAGFSTDFFAILAVGLFAFFLRKKFLSPSVSTNAISVALSTLIFYLILSPRLIISQVFLIELALNEIAGLILFLVFFGLTGLNSQKNRLI